MLVRRGILEATGESSNSGTIILAFSGCTAISGPQMLALPHIGSEVTECAHTRLSVVGWRNSLHFECVNMFYGC